MRAHVAPSPLLASLLILCASSVPACQRPTAEAPVPPAYTTAATIKDLMLSMIDPAADAVWLSVTTVQTVQGVEETRPRTDADWTNVRHGALMLAESANLLMMPGRRVARPGETSETPGVELEPEEMDALIAKDREAWNARAIELHRAADAVLAAVEARDADKVFEVGETIERACENCHSQYWYPNEKIPPVSVSEP
jgi:cytochrome c556